MSSGDHLRFVVHVPFGTDALADVAEKAGHAVTRPDDTAGVIAAASDADALWISPADYTAELVAAVEAHPRVRWIQLASMGYDAVEDVGAAKGVVISNAGNAYAPMVAEHALALALARYRQIPQAVDHQREREWARFGAAEELAEIRSLFGSTVGIYGYGHVGKEIAKRFAGCGARIVAIAPDATVGGDVAEAFPSTKLLEALGSCDVVVIAAPLTDETHKAFDAKAFAAMKDDAVLVNIARGPIVDEQALVAALEAKQIGGAALDVTDPEPPGADSPLWSAPNLLLTAHVAAFGRGVLVRRLADVVAANLAAFVAGDEIATAVPVSFRTTAREPVAAA